MRAATLNAGVVTNIIVLDSLGQYPGAIDGTNANIGDTWNGSAFTRPARNVADIRLDQWSAIKSERDRRTQAGGYLTGGKWYHSDTFSRTQQLGLVLLGASVPPVDWKTMDGTFVAMTQTLAGQIFAAAAASDMALFVYAQTLKAQVDAAVDPASINIMAGWPAIFGD